MVVMYLESYVKDCSLLTKWLWRFLLELYSSWHKVLFQKTKKFFMAQGYQEQLQSSSKETGCLSHCFEYLQKPLVSYFGLYISSLPLSQLRVGNGSWVFFFFLG